MALRLRGYAADLSRLSFVAAFGTICSGVAYGTCKNEKTDGDAEAAAREGGDETADDEVRREEGR